MGVLKVIPALIGAALLAQLPPTSPQLGGSVSAWELVSASEKPIPVSSLLSGKPVILLISPSGCEAVAALNEIGVACKAAGNYRISATGVRVTGIAAFLIDADGILRRVFRDSRSIVSDVRLWRDGQAIFKSQCARCHGESGLATDYPGTKSLAGIGNRHSDKEILHRTDLAGFVDLSSMDERSKRALTIFVAGL